MLVVQEIWRYPVKSMSGERLTRAELDEFGVDGDRSWGVRDEATGLVLTARREPGLLMAAAVHTGGRPLVTTETGEVLTSDADLSDWLGRPVTLVRAADGPGTFENPLDVEHETDWMRWESAPGTFHDGRSRVSLVSTGSLADHDRRRFRINLVMAGDGEDELVDSEVTVGSARLRIRKPIDRCVMVNRAQPGLPADRDVLRRVIRERANLMGVGAVVIEPGSIAVGDLATPT